jgi:hypothetical protein
VPSVTTILQNLSKPALVNWAAKAVAEYAVENILVWEKLSAQAAIDLLKREPLRSSREKMDIGSAVHAAIEAHSGGEPTIDPALLPYVSAAILFLEEHVSIVWRSEATIFNRTYQYAGTCDLIAELKDGNTAIIDWKSGRAIYPEVALQLSGYANGEFIGNDDGTEEELPTIDLGIVVHLPGDGSYVAKEVELTPRLWKTFLALRSVQKYRDDHEASVFGRVHKGRPASNVVPLKKSAT